jgi:hypothetical protein
MKRTTAFGNSSNRYTEGNPALGVPPTVVGAEEMNNIQEELVNIVLGAGMTLNGSTENQAISAILALIGWGGNQIKLTLANNQASPADVTGLLFDHTTHVGAKVPFQITRFSDVGRYMESGELHVQYDAVDGWRITSTSNFDDPLIAFSVNSAGQVQYTSSNNTGANHSCTLRIGGIVKFKA